ncbi:MAG: recombination protein O N-terminal domain-containing protein [Candidatus Paceibacterota bacterium]|jgi:DNA repair protein RecO
MYNIYTTPGFVVGSKPHGEAGKIIFIFTRDFGMVTATAQGIRLEKSKLRYNLQDYSFGTFSLVRGKEFWRLTSGAEQVISSIEKGGPIESGPSNSSGQGKQLTARIALLLRRFLHGEENHPELFDCIRNGIQFLEKVSNITEEQLKTLESVIVFRMLELLGYIGKDSVLQGKLQSNSFSIELLDELASKRVVINQHINKALKESHL